MSGLVRRNFDAPDEVRPFEAGSGKLEVINADGGAVGRAIFEPGWRWSKHVFIAGRMRVVMDDGEEVEYGPGDFADMAPGHDAWIVGEKPCVVVDWQGFCTTPSADHESCRRPPTRTGCALWDRPV